MIRQAGRIDRASAEADRAITRVARPVAVRIGKYWSRFAARTDRFARYIGPGWITGASDDDPSGIATYSQAGAQFGYGMAGVAMLHFA